MSGTYNCVSGRTQGVTAKLYKNSVEFGPPHSSLSPVAPVHTLPDDNKTPHYNQVRMNYRFVLYTKPS